MKKALVTLITSIMIITLTSTSYADVVIYGRGHGHGVGASMAGVYGMAKAGYDYQQIINHYYVNKVWNSRNDNSVIRAKCQKHGIWANISVKEYLYRLAEEPDSWPAEGLKTTMVAARTYLWYKIETNGQFASGQYWIHDINPATRPNIVAAVDATTNQVLTYNNRAIVAAYSSSAGGYTARMSEVWGGSDAPYPYLTNRESSFDSVFSSTFKWTKTLTAAAIENAYPTIGNFSSLTITQRTSADVIRSRVKTIRIAGTSTSVNDSGWNFRAKLGLKSNYFYLSPWPGEPSSPTGSKVLVTKARRIKAKKFKKATFWFRVLDSQNRKVRVYLIIKKRRKRVARIYAGKKSTNRLARRNVIFRHLKPGRYRYYPVAVDSYNNRTKKPGSNLLIIKR